MTGMELAAKYQELSNSAQGMNLEDLRDFWSVVYGRDFYTARRVNIEIDGVKALLLVSQDGPVYRVDTENPLQCPFRVATGLATFLRQFHFQ